MAFLGFDVGGSKCRFEWWPPDTLSGGDAASVQPAVHGVPATVAGLAAALRVAQAIATPQAVVMAVAGVGDRASADAIVEGLRENGFAMPLAVVGDVIAAAAAGLADGPGVLLWAGTGSFALARAADGALHRVGGRGYLLGDQGSAYDLVRRAAAAALLAFDGLGPPTALTAALGAAFGASSPGRLGACLQRLAPGDVAARLDVVLTTAANGDPVADEVVQQGVDALAMLAAAAARQAELDWRELPVRFGGGVFTHAIAMRDAVAERLRAFGARQLDDVTPRAAARGAAWLAHGWFHGEAPQRQWVEHVAI